MFGLSPSRCRLFPGLVASHIRLSLLRGGNIQSAGQVPARPRHSCIILLDPRSAWFYLLVEDNSDKYFSPAPTACFAISCSAQPLCRYHTHKEANDAHLYLNKQRLDTRYIDVELDQGFEDGRQFGRGKHGGQVSNVCVFACVLLACGVDRWVLCCRALRTAGSSTQSITADGSVVCNALHCFGMCVSCVSRTTADRSVAVSAVVWRPRFLVRGWVRMWPDSSVGVVVRIVFVLRGGHIVWKRHARRTNPSV